MIDNDFLADLALSVGTALIDAQPGLRQAAEATLADFRANGPKFDNQQITDVFAYFASFIYDLSRRPDDANDISPEEIMMRLAVNFAAAGLLAFETKEIANGSTD